MAILTKPIITFIGVLMSCDILDRKSDFASFARLASSAAIIQLFSRCFSSVMILTTNSNFAGSPFLSRSWTINLARCQLPSQVRYSVPMDSSFLRRFFSVAISKKAFAFSRYLGATKLLHIDLSSSDALPFLPVRRCSALPLDISSKQSAMISIR